jgi:transposase-like protein
MSATANDSGPDPLKELARMVAHGEATITEVRIRVCGACKVGTLRHTGTLDWQNRFTCDHCGRHVSR